MSNMPANNGSYTFRDGALNPSRIMSSTETTRRCANYKPSFWDFDYIQSLKTEYTEERHSARAAELIVQVKMMMMMMQHQEMEAAPLLELIDDLQRLCISYHFEEEINQILNSIYLENYDSNERDLYSTALRFRLLREHGFQVSKDVFDCFKNEKGEFKSSLDDDRRGVLQLYEASFLLTQGEESLELANVFATKFLQGILDDGDGDDDDFLELVRHALDLPIHWRIQRPNGRWFIEDYGRRPQINPILLELAKLEFNITQAMQQEQLKIISRWWKQTHLSEELPFARDRVVECYLFTLDGFSQPQCDCSRITATKFNILIITIDDIFDVYGTLEELHLFNDVIQRWDLEAMDQLPHYMKICFLALNNFINEMAYDVLKDQDILIIPHLRKSWQDLCKSFIQETQWHEAGYTPSLDEYMSNGWISSSVHVILCHTFFLMTNPIENATVESLYKYHDLVRYSAIIFRLTNDLATSPHEMERGDVAKSVQCYMMESGASVEEARKHVKFMIWETWKLMNEERVGNSQFSINFIKCAVDLARMAHYAYQLGDGVGIQNPHIKNRICSLLFEPIV